MQDARRTNGVDKEDVAAEGSGPLCTQLKENGALLVGWSLCTQLVLSCTPCACVYRTKKNAERDRCNRRLHSNHVKGITHKNV